MVDKWSNKHILLYFCVGLIFLLLVVVAINGSSGSEGSYGLHEVARDLAIAIGPVWMLGLLYQHFLFKEIREAATDASAEALLEQTQPLIDKITQSAQDVQTEVLKMVNLRGLGIERAYKKRKDALPVICEWLRAEEEEIVFVGTSLRGLFWNEAGGTEVRQILQKRLGEQDRTCRFRFLFTHPAFFCITVGNTDGRNSIYTSFEQNHFIPESINCERLASNSKESIDSVFSKSLEEILSMNSNLGSPSHVHVAAVTRT